MPPDVLKCLHDAAQACALIRQFARNQSVELYRADVQLRSAVERQFITLGEALQQAVRIDPQIVDAITDFRRIVNFRNVLVHGYAHIVPDTVWGIVEKDVPLLDEEIQRLMSVGEGPSS
jgi:uncharacterized protein with HEPN domain